MIKYGLIRNGQVHMVQGSCTIGTDMGHSSQKLTANRKKEKGKSLPLPTQVLLGCLQSYLYFLYKMNNQHGALNSLAVCTLKHYIQATAADWDLLNHLEVKAARVNSPTHSLTMSVY